MQSLTQTETQKVQQIDENTESFRNFVSKFRNSPITKQAYTDWLRRFMDYCNLPDVKTRIGIDIGDNTDLLLFDDNRKIQNIIKRFIDYQYDVRGLSPVSVRGYYLAIKHFYQSNEIMLNWPIIKDYVGVTTNMKRSIDMPYTYEEIHKMLDKADERERVIILLLASTGMRRGALYELKYGDVKWINQYQIYEVTIYKGFKEEYKTYCSMECAFSINSYLDFRKRNGERITAESYLIRKQFNTRNRQGLIKISDATDPPHKHKITMRNLESIIYRLIYDAGIRNYDEKKGRLGDRHKNMAAHSFRKFFENKCLEGGVDPFYVSVLMGHKAGIGVEKHYYRPDSIQGEFSLMQLYVNKAMPYLTISDESRLKLKNRELEIRMREDEERFKRAIQERESRYDTLAAQILALNKKLGL